jgi:WD40 repeat protein
MVNSTNALSMLRFLVPALLWVPLAGAAEPPIVATAFAPDGKTVIIGSQRGVQRRSWPDLAPLEALPCKMSHVHDVALSPHGNLLAAVGGSPAESGSLQLFRWPDGTSLDIFQLAGDVFYQVAWREDGRQLALAGSDGRVVLVDGEGQITRELVGHSRSVMGVTYLNRSPYLVSVGLDQTVRVWDTTSGKSLRQMNHHTRAVRDVAARPNDESGRHLLATASDDGTVRLWWPVVGRLVRFARLESPALAIAWSPDGSHLLAACRDGHLRVIDPDTVKILKDIPISDGWAHTVTAAPQHRSAVVGGAGGAIKRFSYASQ